MGGNKLSEQELAAAREWSKSFSHGGSRPRIGGIAARVEALMGHIEAVEAERSELIESSDALIDEQDSRIRSLEQTLHKIKQETRLSSDQANLGTAINRLLRIWDLVERGLVSNEQGA